MKKIRVTSANFSTEGWETEHIFMNTITKGLTFTQNSQYVTLSCPPGNPHNPGFHQGAVYLDLTTKDNTATSVLRRLRLRNNKQMHRLDEISTLKYSTYIVANISNSAPVLVLQLETNPSLGLNQSDANIFFDPRYQTGLNPLGDRVAAQPAVVLNKWQEWDAAAGGWVLHNAPGTPGENLFTLSSYIKLHPDARIINTSIAIPQGGGGVRFTVGGSPDYDNFKGYVDGFTINTIPIVSPMNRHHNKPHDLIIYDFDCVHSEHTHKEAEREVLENK